MTKEKNKRVVYIVGGGGGGYTTMFKAHGWDVTNDISECDLVQFTGGEDVSPSFYGHGRHPKTFNNPARDEDERAIYLKAQGMGLPCAGICRGGQFLNVMNGGKMWQDVDNHTRSHKAKVLGHIGDVMVTSTHHQMINPNYMAEHLILMTAEETTFKEEVGPNGIITRRHTKYENQREDDIESIYYPETNTLCFQPHPEFGGAKDCQMVYFYFLNNYLLKELDIEAALKMSKVAF